MEYDITSISKELPVFWRRLALTLCGLLTPWDGIKSFRLCRQWRRKQQAPP